MQHSSVQPLKLLHGSRRNSGPLPRPPHNNRYSNGPLPKPPHDSKPSLPSKPNYAQPLRPPHDSRPLNRHNSAPLLPPTNSTPKLAGIQGSHPARSDGHKKGARRTKATSLLAVTQ